MPSQEADMHCCCDVSEPQSCWTLHMGTEAHLSPLDSPCSHHTPKTWEYICCYLHHISVKLSWIETCFCLEKGTAYFHLRIWKCFHLTFMTDLPVNVSGTHESLHNSSERSGQLIILSSSQMLPCKSKHFFLSAVRSSLLSKKYAFVRCQKCSKQ